MKHIRWSLALALLPASLPVLAQDAPAPSTAWLALVAPIVERLDGPPKAELKAKYQPVVVAGKNLAVGDAGTSYGVPIRVIDLAQVRSEQLAYFTLISGVKTDDGKANVTYSTPGSGHSGTVVLERRGDAWVVSDVRQAHSSSGARVLFGSLYDGVACRDGTEMAGRWSYQAAMMTTLLAGKKFDPSAEVPKICPGTEFPEVAAYRKVFAKPAGSQ